MLAAACRHLVKLDDVGAAWEGDVLVFLMRDGGVAKHAGILVSAFVSRPGRYPEERPEGASRSMNEFHPSRRALIAGGFGLATVAAKIERGKDKTVQDIADEALRRN